MMLPGCSDDGTDHNAGISAPSCPRVIEISRGLFFLQNFTLQMLVINIEKSKY